MDPITKIINRRMRERQRAKDSRRVNFSPPLSPQTPVSDTFPAENPAPCYLLNIPFLLRRIILRLLLGMEEVRTVNRRQPNDFFILQLYDVKYSIDTAILRTCKQLSEEGSMILRENSFVAVPNFRSRIGHIPTWKLPQSLSSEITPILTVRSTVPHEKKNYSSLISILDFRLYCNSLLYTVQKYQSWVNFNEECSFELEFIPGLVQKLWGFPDEKSFLDYISGSIFDFIGPLVKTIRIGDFELGSTEGSSTNGTHQPQMLNNLEQKIWDIFKPLDPEATAPRFPAASQRIRDAFVKAENLFEKRHLSQALNEFILVKDMIISTKTNDKSRLKWCLFRMATMETANDREGFDRTRNLNDLLEAEHHTEAALNAFSSSPRREYWVRLTFRRAELLAMLTPRQSENKIIELLCQVALDVAPEALLPLNERLEWVHTSVHGDDVDHWSHWDPAVRQYGRYRMRDADGLEDKVDRVRDLIRKKYGDEAKWEDFSRS